MSYEIGAAAAALRFSVARNDCEIDMVTTMRAEHPAIFVWWDL